MNPPSPPSTAAPVAHDDTLVVRCWGTRGSIPTPGPGTVRYGGNTSCVEVRVGDRRLVFDAGTGIRPLGLDLVREGPDRLDVFLTHFHWDHIQGFPFFAPLYDGEDAIRVMGPKQEGIDVRSLFAGQMGPIYFPVPYSFVAARMTFDEVGPEPCRVGSFEISSMRVRHPSHTVGYRIEHEGRVVCFVPDNELEGARDTSEQAFWSRMVTFVEGADLLIHDAMYTRDEYPKRRGWGHSTFDQTLRLAEEAGVRRLLFTHHDPTRDDDALDLITDLMRERSASRGGPELGSAREGEAYRIEPRTTPLTE